MKLILKNWDGTAWIGFVWLKVRISVGCYEQDNEPPGSIEGGVLLNQLSNCQLLMKGTDSWN